jgi:hypothetical protein
VHRLHPFALLPLPGARAVNEVSAISAPESASQLSIRATVSEAHHTSRGPHLRYLAAESENEIANRTTSRAAMSMPERNFIVLAYEEGDAYGGGAALASLTHCNASFR